MYKSRGKKIKQMSLEIQETRKIQIQYQEKSKKIIKITTEINKLEKWKRLEIISKLNNCLIEIVTTSPWPKEERKDNK